MSMSFFEKYLKYHQASLVRFSKEWTKLLFFVKLFRPIWQRLDQLYWNIKLHALTIGEHT